MLYMLRLYRRIDLAVEYCCWHSNARLHSGKQPHPAAFLLPLVFEPGGDRLTWQERYLSTKGRLPAAAAAGRGHACCTAAACSTAAAAAAAALLLFVHAGVCCVATSSMDV